MEAFLKTIDCYVMGSRTYETALSFEAKGLGWSYGDKPTFVLTSRDLPRIRDTVKFYSGDLVQLVNGHLRPTFQTIWFVGGGGIARGEGHHYVLKRLQNADTVLDATGMDKLRTAARLFAGRPYDLTFDWSDDRIYCSELVWKAYDRGLGIQIGTLQTIRDFNLTDPAVRAKMRERYGDSVPLTEPVISPVAMFRSALLVTIAER